MDSSTTCPEPEPMKKALTHGLALWAVVAPVWVLVASALDGGFAIDFRRAFLPAAHAVLRGATPYSAEGSRALAEGMSFLYPPLSAYLLAPFTLFPPLAAEIVAVVLVAAAVPATLLVLGVRDWRCHAIAFVWWPTIIGIQTANLTLPMLVGIAVLWRYRDRKAVVALVAGLVISLKLVFWPILVWLVATRRYRDAALAAAATAVFVLVPWGGTGFAGLRGYPHLLSSVSRSEGPGSYSVAALLHAVFLSWTAAIAVETLLGAALVAVVFVVGRRGRDRDAFALSLLAVLVLSPLLEMHYLALLFVVVGLYRRTFGPAWALPLLIWAAPAGNVASLVQNVHVLVVVAATLAVAYSDWSPERLVRAFGPGRRETADPASLSY
jgi:alpha-1,2-mannosyltransferase